MLHQKNEWKVIILIKSKIFKDLFHSYEVDLFCYESMNDMNQIDLYCEEKLTNE